MNRPELIDKIQKLRSLANSNSSLEEAASAARIAEKLIQANSIDEAELEAKTGSSEFPIEDPDPFTDWKLRQTVWQSSLLVALATAYDCKGILKDGVDGSYGFYAVGRPSALATLRYQYSYFRLELTRLANALAPSYLRAGSGKTWYKSFFLGAVSAIKASLVSAKTEVRSQASSSALIVLNQHAIEAANKFKELYPRTHKTQSANNIDPQAYAMGKQAGAGLQQKPALAQGVRGYLGK